MNEKIDVLEKKTTIKDFSSPTAKITQSKSRKRTIIFSLLMLFLLASFAMSMCSSPPPPQKKMLIAIDSNWYFLRSMNREKNMTAFLFSLLHEIAKQQKIQMTLREVNSDTLQRNFEEGLYDGIVTAKPPNFHNSNYVSSDPLYYLGPVLLVINSSSFNSIDQMKGKIIGGIRLGQAIAMLNHNDSIIFTNYDEVVDGLADLENGKIDGFIMKSVQAGSYLQSLYAGKFKILPYPFSDEGIKLFLANDKQSQEFISSFNAGLKILKENKRYSTLIQTWNLINTDSR